MKFLVMQLPQKHTDGKATLLLQGSVCTAEKMVAQEALGPISRAALHAKLGSPIMGAYLKQWSADFTLLIGRRNS
jgi:hypothetical protein